MFGADVAMVEAAGLVDGELDDFLGTRGQADLAGDRFLAAADDELDGGAHFGELDAEVGEDAAATPSVSRTRPKRMCSVPM